MNIRKVLLSTACSAALCGPASVRADDTDIYFNPNPPTDVGAPMVMMTLDMKANNLSADFCTYDGSGSDECHTKLGDEIYPFLKKANDDYGLNYEGNGVNRFDAFRALHATLFDELEGVMVGFMISHNEQTDNGGYILRGFELFEENDANGSKQELLEKLYSIPNPKGATATGGGGGGGGGGSSGGSCSPAAGTDKTLAYTASGSSLSFSVTDASATAGGNLVFTVTGSGLNKTNGTLVLNAFTVNDTAVSVSDYTAQSASGSTAKNKAPFTTPNATSFTVTVPTVGAAGGDTDTTQEQFILRLTMAGTTDVAEGIGTICPNVPTEISVADTSVSEGGDMQFTVTAAPTSSSAITMDYTIAPDTATTPADYDGTVGALTGTVTIPANTASATVSINTVDDATFEGNEQFTITLSNPSSATIVDATGIGVISDNDACGDGGAFDHKFQGTEMYFELTRYLTGGPVLSGKLGAADYGSSSATTLPNECYLPGGTGILGWDAGIMSGANYISPLVDAEQCTKIYTVGMMFGVSNQDNELNSTIGQPKGSYGLGSTPSNSNSFADIITLLENTDFGSDDFPTWNPANEPEGTQNVNNYIIKLGGPSGQFAPYAAAGANVIEGNEDDLEELLELLRDIFRDILSVSTTFVSASVPVDVFNRANVNDNVYIAVFTVDEDGGPIWNGNVKKLRLGIDNSTTPKGFFLHDVATPAASAIDPDDGRIRYDALTYWTDAAGLPVPGDSNDVDAGDEQDFKEAGFDGRFVARGAAGHKIPGQHTTTPAVTANPSNPGETNAAGPRKVFTDNGSALIALDLDDATGTALQTALGAASLSEAKQLICYARGIGNCVNVVGSSATPVARSWMMADALHSRPLPLNYGAFPTGSHSKSNPNIRLLVGTNDGMFHMINNTATGTSCGDTDGDGVVGAGETACTESGDEVWAYMPRELLGIQKTLYAGTVTPGESMHPIGVDGEAVVYVNAGVDNSTIDYTAGDDAWVFFGLRRGGRGLYALDISNPDSPALKWKITNSTSGFSELGYTFSTPQIAEVQYQGTIKTVLVFGGGYYGDGGNPGTGHARVGYDDPATKVNEATMGNAIFIVDAETGALIWKVANSNVPALPAGAVRYVDAEMDHSIPAEINIFDSNNDGVDDRAYVGDLGGNVWRIDLAPDEVNDSVDGRDAWQVVRIATLGGIDEDDRRFANAVDVVLGKEGGSAVDFVLLGSGDRENPKDDDLTNPVENYFFALKDTSAGNVPVPASVVPYEIDDLIDADCFLASGAPSCNATELAKQANGWKLELTQPGEKVLASAISLAGTTYFTSYLPEGEPGAGGGSACGNFEGSGRVYAVNTLDATPVKNNNLSDDNGNTTGSTSDDRYDPLASAGIPSRLVPLGPGHLMLPDLSIESTGNATHYRTYWYEKDVDD